MSERVTAPRFYRPELDALRFFAFLAVLLCHGPGGPGFPGALKDAGVFGLSMFFLLSAYLITELLLREREQSGTIAWGPFFIRRALRIWPLYYAAIAVAVMIARLSPDHFGFPRAGMASLALFFGNWNRRDGPLLYPLWSISIEEQFYLVWPPIVKLGGQTLAFAAAFAFILFAGVWLRIFSGRGWSLWFDTPIEFLFFAAGAIIALALRRNPGPRINRIVRSVLLIAGLSSFAVAESVGHLGAINVNGLSTAKLCVGYSLAVGGSVAIFLAVLGVSRVPRTLIYLGKISYGLYVFHAGMLYLSRELTAPLRLAPGSGLNMLVVDSAALLLCIPAAHLSYQYFEKPFLRFKERFEVVKSRPV